LALTWALIDLMTERLFPEMVAAYAAETYNRFFGDAAPVLARAPLDGTDSRAYLILSALKAPLSAGHETAVLVYVCDALQSLLAFQSQGQQNHPPRDVDLVLRSEKIISESCRLVSPERRRLIKEFIVTADLRVYPDVCNL
jgi:hypothetical protein